MNHQCIFIYMYKALPKISSSSENCGGDFYKILSIIPQKKTLLPKSPISINTMKQTSTHLESDNETNP